jgi:phosphohistidine phosphatase SixA
MQSNRFLSNYTRFKSVVLAAIALFLFSSHAVSADTNFQEVLATPALLEQMRSEGGLVIYMRHGITDNTRPDRAPSVDLNDCSTQRMLSDAGRELSKQVGLYVKQANIPHDFPIVSPMCRAKETAELAYGDGSVDTGLTYSGSMTSVEKTPILARTKELLSLPVPKGTNRLLVAHAPNLMDIMGYFPKEATLVIFKPEGDYFTYLGSIPPTHWKTLLAK